MDTKKRNPTTKKGLLKAAKAVDAANPAPQQGGRPTGMTPNEEVALLLGREILTAETELEEYDFGEYCEDARLIIFLGKRNTGKTVLMYNYCYLNRHLYPYGLVVTKTKHNNFWQQIFPQHLIITKFDKAVIGAFMEAQRARVQERGVNSRVLLVLDDMASDHVMRYANELTTLAYNGRHYNVDIIFATQDIVKATTAMRRNADLFVMMTTMNLTTLDHVYKEFASVDYKNFTHFCANQLKHTEDYGAFIIDNTDPSARGKDRYFKFKATLPDELPTFTMLSQRAWGPNKQVVVEKQRETYKQIPKYSANYMRQLKNAEKTALRSEQVQGSTEQQRRHDDENPFNTLLGRR